MKIEDLSDRELDALVAEKVMGLSVEWVKAGDKSYIGTFISDGPVTLEGLHKVSIPHYSTDIAAAWTVVERMRDDSKWNTFKLVWNTDGVRVSFRDDDNRVWGESAPRAICLAALKAVGEK